MSAVDSDWLAAGTGIQSRIVELSSTYSLGIVDVPLLNELSDGARGRLRFPCADVAYKGFQLLGTDDNGVIEIDQIWLVVLIVQALDAPGDQFQLRTIAGPVFARLVTGLCATDWKAGTGISRLRLQDGPQFEEIPGYEQISARFLARVTVGG